MAREPKPWQRGYIPTVGKCKHAGWTAPEAPPGWYRTERRDLVEYGYGNPIRAQYWTPNAALVSIVGGIGVPWRLYRGYDPLHGWSTSPEFESGSLHTVAMWWSIEQSNQPEPEPSGFDDYEEGYTSTGRYTRIGKTVTFGMTYGQGSQQLAVYKQLLDADTAKTKAAADIYADFAKNFKGAKP